MRRKIMVAPLIVGAFTLCLTACESQQEKMARVTKENAAAETHAKAERVAVIAQTGINKVLSQLNDPASATFQSVSVRNGSVVCGQVNSKNKLGGYVGFNDFASSPEGVLIHQETATPSEGIGENFDYDGYAQRSAGMTVDMGIMKLCPPTLDEVKVDVQGQKLIPPV